MAKARKVKPRVTWDADRGLLHIEAPGAIVNIFCGLRAKGNSADVTLIQALADGERYAGERPWWIDGENGKDHLSVRVIRKDTPSK